MMPTKTCIVSGFLSLRKALEFDLPGYSERACIFGRGTTAAPVSFILPFLFKTTNNQNQGSSRLGISARKEGLAGRKNNVLSSLTHVPRCRFSPAPSAFRPCVPALRSRDGGPGLWAPPIGHPPPAHTGLLHLG